MSRWTISFEMRFDPDEDLEKFLASPDKWAWEQLLAGFEQNILPDSSIDWSTFEAVEEA